MKPVAYTNTELWRMTGGVGFSVTLEDKGGKWLDGLGGQITRVMKWITSRPNIDPIAITFLSH